MNIAMFSARRGQQNKPHIRSLQREIDSLHEGVQIVVRLRRSPWRKWKVFSSSEQIVIICNSENLYLGILAFLELLKGAIRAVAMEHGHYQTRVGISDSRWTRQADHIQLCFDVPTTS